MRIFLRVLALAACGLVALQGTARAQGNAPVAQGNAPVIESLDPATVAAGSGAFTLTIDGSRFQPHAEVRWNGQARPTIHVNGRQLRASITASDVAQAGSAHVTVFVPLGQGRLSNQASFAISPPATTPAGPPAEPPAATPAEPPAEPPAAPSTPPVATPVVASLAPSSAAAGGEPVSLVVNGSSFIAGAEIHWNGSRRSTTGSTTRLTTTIPAADLITPGAAQVRVVNPGAGSPTSDARSFSVLHQTPRILSFEPERVTEGHGDFKLKIVGSNFIRSTTTVLWNGAARETRFIGPTEVEASIRAADVASGGGASIVVRSETGGSTRASEASTFPIALGPRDTYVGIPDSRLIAPSITSFQIANGRPYVSVGTSVGLEATASGEADKFRTAARQQGCATDLAAVAWKNWNPASPPQWRSSSTGTKRVCFQVGRTNGSNVLASSPAEDAIDVVEAIRTTAWVGTRGTDLDLIHTGELVAPWGFIVGLVVREGDWIDAAGTRRTQLGPNGEHLSVGDDPDGLDGGSGGVLRIRTCPSGEVINAVRGRRGAVIESLQVGCRPWNQERGTYGSQRWLPRDGGTGGNSSYELTCPAPLAAIYVHFSALNLGFGTYVGGVRIVCIVPPGL